MEESRIFFVLVLFLSLDGVSRESERGKSPSMASSLCLPSLTKKVSQRGNAARSTVRSLIFLRFYNGLSIDEIYSGASNFLPPRTVIIMAARVRRVLMLDAAVSDM